MTWAALRVSGDRRCAEPESDATALRMLKDFVASRCQLQFAIRSLVTACECGFELDMWLAISALGDPVEQLKASLDALRAAVPRYDRRALAALYETVALHEWITALLVSCRGRHMPERDHCRLCELTERQCEQVRALMALKCE